MLTYEFHPAKSIVIREGDLSNNKFYIVLNGRVTIYVRHAESYKKEKEHKPQ
jgi:CRP-like cAMP-binding protein